MKNALIAILLCGVAVAACDANRKEQVAADNSAEISIDAGDDGEKTIAGVDIKADMESGEVEMRLPGGLQGKVRIPAGLEADAKFDLEGLGRYPGAKLVNVNVAASGTDNDGKGEVVLGFTAPGTATQVADWYARAMTGQGRLSGRSGNTLTGTTEDGDRMVIAVDDDKGGIARGRITITDRKG